MGRQHLRLQFDPKGQVFDIPLFSSERTHSDRTKTKKVQHPGLSYGFSRLSDVSEVSV